MHHIRTIVAVTAVLTLAGFATINVKAQAVASPGHTTSPHFWDDIPVSPSTTSPEKIEDGYWQGQFERVNREVAQADNTDIVFFGDSITWYWSQANGAGKSVWKETYQDLNPINMGNSGGITPVMLYRVTHGNLDFARAQAPKVAVLLCGTNNFVVTQSAGGKVQWHLGPTCPPEDVAQGARAIAQIFRRRLPRTRVIMMGILPVSNPIKWAKCQQANAVNAALAYNPSEVLYLDLQDRFLQPDGSINRSLFSDGTHLTPEGYRVWAERLDPLVSDMRRAGPLNPVKIMLIGGSITEGLSSSTAYRRYLDGMLRRKGYLIDFVGSRKKHNDNHTEPDNYQYDVDHEGHWGRNSDWLAQHMAGLVNEVPDVAVIYMGTEDIVSDHGPAEALTEKVIKNIRTVISALRSHNKTVRIVVAKIIPTPGKTDEVNLLNHKISRCINDASTPLSPVVMADLHTGFSAAADLANGGPWPNAKGATKTAQTLSAAIHHVLSADGSEQ